MAKTIYVLNGPNLNLLGTREPKTYGRATLKDVEKLCRDAGKRHKIEIAFHQSNHEGELIDWIHEAGAKKAAGIVINPGGYTHSSVAIRDAVAAVDSSGDRSAHQQHLCARGFSPLLAYRAGRQGDAERLRRHRLCAGDRRARRPDSPARRKLSRGAGAERHRRQGRGHAPSIMT